MTDKNSTSSSLFPTSRNDATGEQTQGGDAVVTDAPRPVTPARASVRNARLPFLEDQVPTAPGATLPDGETVLTEEPERGFELGHEYMLAGRIGRVRYQSADGFFAIASLELSDGRSLTVRGNLGQIEVGDRLRLGGRWVSSKYGEQLDVQRCEPILPVTPDGIAKFLASQLPGIGARIARRIVDHFGAESTIAVLDTQPERLAEVEGIGPSKLDKAVETWRQKHAQRAALLFLQSHGVTLAMATRIIQAYGDETALKVRSNPYRIARDVRGVGFQFADRIASSLGIPRDSAPRIEAGLDHVLHEAESAAGHCYLPRDPLTHATASLLGVDINLVEDAIQRLRHKHGIVVEQNDAGNDAIFSQRSWQAELAVASQVRALLTAEPRTPTDTGGKPVDTRALVERIGTALGIELAAAQRCAVEQALATDALTVVTGGPGTGKTTLVRVLVEACRRLNWKVHLAAPTGRAAKRLSEATGVEARTVHRMLEFSFQHHGFQRNAESRLPEGLYVVDEVSMIDVYLMRALLEALPTGARLVLVGDVDQLPSVGPGMILRDLIESDVVPLVRLTEVFRQEEASLIVRNAHRINRGEVPLLPERDADGNPVGALEYFAINVDSSRQAEALVVELVTSRLPAAFGLEPMNDIQVLCPMRVRESGADALNLALQARLNPDGQVVGRKRSRGANDDASSGGAIRVGDRVMQLRNDYDKDVYNGDVGRVVRYVRATRETVIDFDGRQVRYGRDELDDVTLAYACTIHKAQGSEYQAVVIPLLRSHFPMLQRNLVYTALTRARRLAIFVGQPSAMRIAVQNAQPAARNTRLAERLRAMV